MKEDLKKGTKVKVISNGQNASSFTATLPHAKWCGVYAIKNWNDCQFEISGPKVKLDIGTKTYFCYPLSYGGIEVGYVYESGLEVIKPLGYVLKKEFKHCAVAACIIDGYNGFGTRIAKGQIITSEESIEKLKRAGVLDLWFEEYVEDKLPLMNDQRGKVENSYLVWPDVKLHISDILVISNLSSEIRASIFPLKVNDVTITIEKFELLVKYVKELK